MEFLDARRIAAADRALTYQRTGASLMKPFITPEVSATGKKMLAFQCEGIDASALRTELIGQHIVAYSLPTGHSFQAAWLFRLILSGGGLLEFSSACTQVVDWQEVGSLNIRFVDHSSGVPADFELGMPTVAIPSLHLQALEKLVYEDADIVSECALVLHGEGSEEVVVAAGIPPGSVSVMASFTKGPFEPQFAISTCKRLRL
jgi:hypothetical protein